MMRNCVKILNQKLEKYMIVEKRTSLKFLQLSKIQHSLYKIEELQLFYFQILFIQTMSHLQFLNTAFMRPVFSPRSEMSRYLNDIQKNKTSLIINIDKETLSLFKNQFQLNDNKVNKVTFLSIGLKILKSWQKDMQYRQSRMIAYLFNLFQEIQDKNQGIYITWEQFNNLIIEKALNLKSLQSNDSQAISQLKYAAWSRGKNKLATPVQKIICINKYKKLAYFCEESNKIQFLNLSGNQHNFKPLVLERQDLMVEKTLVKRVKNQSSGAVLKQNYKKQVIVSGYNVSFLDMIYISSQKYQMLLTSSSDGFVRGWDIHGTTPTLAKQPENQQEKMIHQFPMQIHSMVWDQINDVLYCSAKNSKIYLWIAKTDSEKELWDPEGHHSMISSIIMMPKLQFLATGDYDGKLILWDTISMNKKYIYEQHTRSIVSMTFHEALILLFTSSFDHSICVWNPYIPSLIYKISCNINVIQVKIIPGTNYLAALDSASNLKIREINKFNVISTFVVDRPEDDSNKIQQTNQPFSKIQPTCMDISQDPTRFFFGGHSIKCKQFNQNEGLSASDFYPTILKYHQQKMKLYVVIKNCILIWDILTGQLYNILQNQTQNQISAFDLIERSGRFVVGDSQGTIYLRKLQNGIKISRLYKYKQKIPINHLICRRGGIWNEAVIIACYQDCEVVIFGKDESHDFTFQRSFNLKRTLPNAFIMSIEYEQKRNILIMGTTSGDIIFMDVDKTKIINHIQTKSLQTIKFNIKYQVPSVLAFGKTGQIFGVYLPPHSKKFKPSCNLLKMDQNNQLKVVNVLICKLTNRCYIGYENGIISEILLNEHLTNYENVSMSEPKKVYQQKQVRLGETIKDMILIQDQTVLVVILYMKNIALISTETGEILNILPSYALSQKPNFFQFPLCYHSNPNSHEKDDFKFRDQINQKDKNQQNSKIKEKQREKDSFIDARHQILDLHLDKQKQKENQNQKNKQSLSFQIQQRHKIYIPELKKSFPIQNFTENKKLDKNLQLNFFHNPYYLPEQYLKILTSFDKSKQSKNATKQVSSTQQKKKPIIWNKQWKVFPNFRDKAQKSIEQIIKLQKLVQDQMSKPLKRTPRNTVSRQTNLKKAVEVQKKWEQMKEDMYEQGITKSKLVSLSSYKISSHTPGQSKKQQREIRNTQKQRSMNKHKSLYKNESSPYIRLGLALQKISQKDEKAIKFIEMGTKKNNQVTKSLKFPKIKLREDKY